MRSQFRLLAYSVAVIAVLSGIVFMYVDSRRNSIEDGFCVTHIPSKAHLIANTRLYDHLSRFAFRKVTIPNSATDISVFVTGLGDLSYHVVMVIPDELELEKLVLEITGKPYVNLSDKPDPRIAGQFDYVCNRPESVGRFIPACEMARAPSLLFGNGVVVDPAQNRVFVWL